MKPTYLRRLAKLRREQTIKPICHCEYCRTCYRIYYLVLSDKLNRG